MGLFSGNKQKIADQELEVTSLPKPNGKPRKERGDVVEVITFTDQRTGRDKVLLLHTAASGDLKTGIEAAIQKSADHGTPAVFSVNGKAVIVDGFDNAAQVEAEFYANRGKTTVQDAMNAYSQRLDARRVALKAAAVAVIPAPGDAAARVATTRDGLGDRSPGQ